jgi:3-deoxy-7-phosphoheptulonate synthase
MASDCLPYVFELAGKYGIKVIAMEVTHESMWRRSHGPGTDSATPTGVMLQIGTRNTQNFELLKAVGRQQHLPVLLKRGFGITLDESLNAAEYLASEGNRRVVFGLRGMKTNMGDPHRNFVDFAHVPVVKRLTRMPVCIDPSHSVGSRDAADPTASSTSSTHRPGRGRRGQHDPGGLPPQPQGGAGRWPPGTSSRRIAALSCRCGPVPRNL